MLLGVIFRPRLGAYVDLAKEAGPAAQAAQFADIFVFAAWMGLVAVVLVALEMWRTRRGG